jgi:hypothetical protein
MSDDRWLNAAPWVVLGVAVATFVGWAAFPGTSQAAMMDCCGLVAADTYPAQQVSGSQSRSPPKSKGN